MLRKVILFSSAVAIVAAAWLLPASADPPAGTPIVKPHVHMIKADFSQTVACSSAIVRRRIADHRTVDPGHGLAYAEHRLATR